MGFCRRTVARWSLGVGLAIVVLSSLGLGRVVAAELDEHMAALGMIRFKEHIEAPNFTLTATDGTSMRLSDFAGHPILLNFWATW